MPALVPCWTRPFVWTFIHFSFITSGRRERVKDSRKGEGGWDEGGYVRGVKGVKVKGEKANEERMVKGGWRKKGSIPRLYLLSRNYFSMSGGCMTQAVMLLLLPLQDWPSLLHLAWLECYHFHDTYGPLNCVGINLASWPLPSRREGSGKGLDVYCFLWPGLLSLDGFFFHILGYKIQVQKSFQRKTIACRDGTLQIRTLRYFYTIPTLYAMSNHALWCLLRGVSLMQLWCTFVLPLGYTILVYSCSVDISVCAYSWRNVDVHSCSS